ncbi:amidase signature domain-containing protein [Fusarium redolens]|uniref:Amidase signature domain-containing protein n=1 Tax=Fusarium redolens TaxID=48865 RepID=A0A9P9GUN7_FUSRE|nr:amidase signature domain-containing protein [Fusarium redolens]KAH7244462.1 amidase signature domain-containing protein [Fusarium redolens]
MNSSPYKWTATQALELLKNDTISVEEYAQSLLDRIQDRDRIVKAWAHLDLLSQARLLDKVPVEQRGPLHGLAIGIQDIMDTKDMPTQYGSPIDEGYQPDADSHAVATLRAAGALIFASYTKIFTMKATFNAISTKIHKPCAPSFDTIGFFARSIEDLQLLADVFDLKDDEPPKDTSLDQISVAVIKTPFWSSQGLGTLCSMYNSIDILKRNNVKVEEVSFPPEVADPEVLIRLRDVIIQGEARVSFLPEYHLNKAKLAYEIRDIIEKRSNITRKELRDAYDEYSKMRTIINDLGKNYDIILARSAVNDAPVGLDDMGSPIFNTLWIGFHMPVINIPAFFGAWGMPIGVSLIAPRFHDQQLLRRSKVISEILMADVEERARAFFP